MFYITNRLILRNIKMKDFDAFFKLHNSFHVLHYNCMNKMNEQEVQEYILKHQNDNCVCVIANLKDELMGIIFTNQDSLRYQVNSLELSYWLGEQYCGQGIMFEALSLWISELFTNQKISSITARAFKDNEKSQNLLKRLGFIHEGTLRNAVCGYGQIIHDDCLFSLSKDSWFVKK